MKIKLKQNYKLSRDNFDLFLKTVQDAGYKLVGPKIRDKAIVYDEVHKTDDLPIGWMDNQTPGKYRIIKTKDNTLFNYNVSPYSWKKFLFPPRLTLLKVTKNNKDVTFDSPKDKPDKIAFLGVKPCELKAIEVQDKVFTGSDFKDNHYNDRRANALIISTDCTKSSSTCFCTSMNSGPKAESGFDIALTEVYSNADHFFTIKAATKKGLTILSKLTVSELEKSDISLAEEIIDNTTKSISRKLDTEGLKEILDNNLNHEHWDKVAEKCISCTNCTMVCPTCFCSDVKDITSLDGATSERIRTWDSCFSMEYSYIHGGAVRATTRSRYRQWLTHKFAGWFDQFDQSGCVGCGRCIAWCPVGIEINKEAAAIKDKVTSASQNEQKAEMVK